MRYRKIDCYPAHGGDVVTVIWQDDSKIFDMKEIRSALRNSDFKKVSEGVICNSYGDKSKPYGFYFIPETHPLFNCLIFTSDLASYRIDRVLRKAVMAQLLNILQQ